MAKNPQKKFVTKKHLARLEREKLQTRYIIIVSAVILFIVVVMVGYGFVEQFVIQPDQSVAIVNGDEISTREFQVNVRFSRLQLINQYLQTQQFMQMLGGDESYQDYFDQSLQAIRFQLESATLGQNILDSLVEDRLIRQEAARSGVVVTEEEIDKAIQADFNYFPDGTPTPTATKEAVATSTLSPTQLALIPPTATETITTTSEAEATSTPTLEINPSPEITPTSTSAPTLTPTPYTEVAFRENYQSYIGDLDRELDISEAEIRYIYESRLYREKVFALVTVDVPDKQDQVWARHILVSDEATAQEIYKRLQAGEDFSALAAEASIDTSNAQNGGDLGWFGIGRMDPEFEKVAFNLDIGQLSSPFQTSFGWHIVQVLGKEERPLSTSDYQQLKETEFSAWLDTMRNESEIEIFDYWADRVPVVPALPPSA